MRNEMQEEERQQRLMRWMRGKRETGRDTKGVKMRMKGKVQGQHGENARGEKDGL